MNPASRLRESLAEGEPAEKWIRSEERYRYIRSIENWLVKLPFKTELRDHAGVPFAVRIQYFDGPPFIGLPEGQVEGGILTRVQELRLLESLIPADYVGDRVLSDFGYELRGTDDTRGYYSTTLSVRRDNRGNILEHKDQLGSSLMFSYDSDGVFPFQVTDALGRITSVVFNPRSGEPSRVSYSDGRTVRYEHDAVGRLRASYENDDAGNEQLVKSWILDSSSMPVSVTSISPHAGGRNITEFNTGVDFESLEGVVVSRVYYDGTGKAYLQISTGPDTPAGGRRFVTATRSLLNVRNQVAAEFPPGFMSDLRYVPFPAVGPASVRMRYDAFGSKEESLGPGLVHHLVVRDNFTIRHFEGAGAGTFGSDTPPGPLTRIEKFDARSRLYRIEEAKGDGTFVSTSYDLTLDGHIEVVRDNDASEVTRYIFAGPDQAIRIINRDAGTRSYYRDAAGRLIERVNPDGSHLFYSYDLLGRMTRIESALPNSPERKQVREIIYDAYPDQPSTNNFLEGRPAIVREPGYTIRYSYNRAGKLVREEITTGNVTLVTRHEYTLQGKLKAITYPDGHRIEYTLDRSGLPSAIPGVLSSVSYNPTGAVEGYLLVNGVEIYTPRDPVTRRLSEVTARKGGVVLRSLSYGYDPVGDVTSIRDEIPGDIEFHTFGYDGLYRLSSFQVQSGDSGGGQLRSGSYLYDTAGNLLQLAETKPLSFMYSDTSHPWRLTAVVSGPVTQPVFYEDRGHVRAFGDVSTLEYDALDRLTHIVKSDGTELRMTYDPQNRRLLKEIKRGSITSLVRYATGLFEDHGTHALRHIYLGNGLVASEKATPDSPTSTNTAYYLTDHHGTIVLATDAAGGIVQNQRYSPFGLTFFSTVSLDRYLGRERDIETGLLHLGSRYYAPILGRFISPDWFVLENPSKPARLPQGFNPYSYAINNPLVFKDASGMFFFLIAIAIAFAVGFVAGTVYGLTKGQGWSSLLTGLETGLTTGAGFALGAGAGFLLGSAPGVGTVLLAGIGGAMGGLNGLLSGMHGIHDWEHPGGWLAFLTDSTWGLLGTSIGNFVQVANIVSGAKYRDDLSHRQNRNVYEGGIYIAKDDAFTQGNVISNAGRGGKGIDMNLIDNHESLHILQNRIFGPLFQTVYVGWMIGAFIVGSIFWLFHTDHDYGSIIETAAYYDNPWEYWAYSNQHYWPPTGQSGFDPIIAWG